MYLSLMYSKDLIKGTLQPIILMLLNEHNRMYGYEMTQKVKELTRGKIEITEGALYPTLHKLVDEKILTAETEFIGKRVRKYYSLTKAGNEVASSKVDELSDFLATIGMLLKPKATI